MSRKTVVFSVALLGVQCLAIRGQQAAASAVFTVAQAGRAAYENSCGRCHTFSLLGRKGEEGGVPPLASLALPYLKFIGTRPS